MNSSNSLDDRRRPAPADIATLPSSFPVRHGNQDIPRVDRHAGPPLRKDAASHTGPDQPAWFDAFVNGDIPTSPLALPHVCNWCMRNKEPEALLWVLERTKTPDLTVPNLNDDQSTVLFKALVGNTIIEELSFCRTTFTEDTARLLGNVLSTSNRLTHIGLHEPQFIGSALSVLAEGLRSDSGLRSVALLGCNLDGSDWQTIVASLKNHQSLEAISIDEPKLPPDAAVIFQYIIDNPKIREVTMRNIPLTAKDAATIARHLANNPPLKRLVLDAADLDSSGGSDIARALVNNSTLEALSLANNRLGPDFGVACSRLLETNNTLESLVLEKNQLGEQGIGLIADALKKNRKLAAIDLDRTGINEHSGLAIAGMLAENATLSELNISHNQCGDKAGRAILASLGSNTSMQALYYTECGFSDDSRMALANVTQRNKEARQGRERNAMLVDAV